jgi:hypothetical protein
VLAVQFFKRIKTDKKTKDILFSMFCVCLIVIFGVASLNLEFNHELKESSKFIQDVVETDPFNGSYAIVHTSTFSQSPYKVYFKDSNIQNYLVTNLSEKRLFTAGGSIIESWERISLDEARSLDVDTVYFVSNKQLGEKVIWEKGGLYITRDKNSVEMMINEK